MIYECKKCGKILRKAKNCPICGGKVSQI